MAITIHGEYWRGRSADLEYQAGQPVRGRFTRIFSCTSTQVTEASVLAEFLATRTVLLGQPYPEFPASVAKRMRAVRVDGANDYYRIEIQYEPHDEEEQDQGHDDDGNPTFDPNLFHDEVDVSYTQISEAVEKAVYLGGFKGVAAGKVQPGDVVVPMNSALQPFNPPLERELDIKVVRITKFRQDYDGAHFDQFQGRINKAPVTINKIQCRYRDKWGKHQARCKNIGGQFQITNGVKYWRVTFEIHVHPRSWDEEVPDRGLHARALLGDPNGKGGTISNKDNVHHIGVPALRRLVDPRGVPISDPVLLDGDGQPLVRGEGDQLEPVYITYQKYPEIDFKGMRL